MFVFAAVFSGTLRVAVAAEKAGGALAVIALVTAVAATARLPLAAASKTASAASATVRFVAVVVRAVVRVSSTVGPATLAALVAAVTLLAWMVMSFRLTPPMSSLNVRITVVPSVDVVGAAVPVVTSVGRMPSTLCPASIMTATWSRSAALVVLPVAVMVPPVSLFAAIAMPFGAESPTTTV